MTDAEKIQIIHYAAGGEYKPHYDFFDTENPAVALLLKRLKQRHATVIVYLNDVQEGGETWFPTLDVTVKPVKGDGLLFWNIAGDGTLIRASLHAGRPVTAGEKWIATKWLARV